MKASLAAGLVLTLVAVALAAPFFSRPEMFAAFDSPTHLHWSASFRQSLSEGNLYPRWQPEAFGGYGAPTFVFYPVVSYYVASVFSAFGDAGAVKLSLALALLLSGMSQYRFLRDLASPPLALLGAIAYLALPAHLAQASPFFLVSSLWALVFLPLAFRGARRAARKEGVTLLALGAGGLLASHLPTAATGLPLALLFGLLAAARGQRLSALGALGRGFVWGAALGALYWMPALLESPSIQARYHVEWNRLEDNFLYASSHPLGPGYLAVNHLLSLAVSLAVALGLFSYLLGRSSSARLERRFFASLCGGAFFLMTPLSRSVWSLLPAARWLEFPWRLVNLELLATSVLLALSFDRWPERRLFPRAIWGGATLGVLALNLFFSGLLLSEVTFFSPEVDREALATGIYEVVAFLPKDAPPPQGKYQKASRPRDPAVELLRGDAEVRVERWVAEERTVRIVARSPTTLRLRLFAFPGWVAERDGFRTPLQVEPETGALLAEVPAGAERLRLSFRASPPRRVAGSLSALGLLILAGSVARRWSRRRNR